MIEAPGAAIESDNVPVGPRDTQMGTTAHGGYDRFAGEELARLSMCAASRFRPDAREESPCKPTRNVN